VHPREKGPREPEHQCFQQSTENPSLMPALPLHEASPGLGAGSEEGGVREVLSLSCWQPHQHSSPLLRWPV
jgi:hypothetical protein